MKILVINSGSSSLKFTAFKMPEENVLMSGYFERIGLDNSFYTLKVNGEKIKKELDLTTHKEAIDVLIKELFEYKIINDLTDIKGVGHRVVHGSDLYDSSVVITDEVIKNLEEISDLAPLHNPANIMGMKEFIKEIPSAVNVVTPDTAFHQTIEPKDFLYPVPYEWYEKYNVRKFGFHGTSHKYVSEELERITGKKGNFIICHLGSGCSITAIKDGKSIDTSMGFTPNAGVMMSTRTGDIDATLIPYVMEKSGKTIDEIVNDMNKNSGLLGISGVSADQRDIFEGIEEGNEKCILANDMFNKRIAEYIAKYYLLLGNVDALAFTAGIGERSKETRRDVIKLLKPLGFELDEEANKAFGEEAKISTDNSIETYVIPTDEEVMIARDTFELID